MKDLKPCPEEALKNIVDFIEGYMKYHNRPRHQATRKVLNTLLHYMGLPQYKIEIIETKKKKTVVTNKLEV